MKTLFVIASCLGKAFWYFDIWDLSLCDSGKQHTIFRRKCINSVKPQGETSAFHLFVNKKCFSFLQFVEHNLFEFELLCVISFHKQEL